MFLLPTAFAWAGGVGLAVAPFAEIEVAVVEPVAIPEDLPVTGPFRLVGVVDGVRTYEAPLPVRPRVLFYERPPDGMVLKSGRRNLYYSNDPLDRGHPNSWEFTANSLMIRVGRLGARPTNGDYTLRYPRATRRERALSRTAEEDAAIFARRTAQVDEVSRQGVYLPVPALAGWDVDVPERGILRFSVGILPPEVADGSASDGADLFVEVVAPDAVDLDGPEVGRWRVTPGAFADHRVDLSAYAGRRVRLRMRTMDTVPTRDAVFIASPTVFTPTEKPRRVVLAFIDTLRRDHLPTYGYKRATTPKIAAWAKEGVVFDDARTVAPWTLPSARTLLTGQEPENWSVTETLQHRLAAQGWATGAYVGNVYLSSNFQMADGWGEHNCVNWPRASYEVAHARRFLADHADQDALVMVHFMDMHLPYQEPRSYRGLFAGKAPSGLAGGFNRNQLVRAAMRQRDLVKQYLVDRYDQNLRYLDDELSGFLAEQPDDAIVVLFSDHGEEFFDHDSVEHGHTLYDELMRIPMFVHAPGQTPATVAAPVSIADITPTVLDLLGQAAPGLFGRSLATLITRGADATFDHRVRAFGRPLYGFEAWGAVRDSVKYSTIAGTERIIDLAADASEIDDLVPAGSDPEPGRAWLAEGLGRPVNLVYRFTPTGHSRRGVTIDIRVPGGIARWWIGDDPTKLSVAEATQVDAETLQVSFASRLNTHREVFVLPTLPVLENVENVEMKLAQQDDMTALHYENADGAGTLLGRTRTGGWVLEASWGVMPMPTGTATSGADPELKAALEALGYAVGTGDALDDAPREVGADDDGDGGHDAGVGSPRLPGARFLGGDDRDADER